MRKVIFFALLSFFLILIPVTVLRVTPLELALKSPANLTNFIQRILGLTLFTLLFVQVLLGAFMTKFTNKLGEWIFNYHVIEGLTIYTIAFLHALSFMVFNRFTGSGWNPYFVFVDICLLCQTPIDYYYTLGRISFWLLTVTVFAAIFRKTNPWMRENWRKLHVINYAVFLIVGAHGFFIGTDFRSLPFYLYAIVSYAIVTGVVMFIELPRLYKNYMAWITS